MAAATQSIDTYEKKGLILENLPVEANAALYVGTIGALNGASNAVPASDTAGLRVLGRVEPNPDGVSGDTVDVGGPAGTLSVNIKRGVFVYANSQGDPLGAGDVGRFCYVEDNQTVNKTGGNNKIAAGRFLGFYDGNAAKCVIDFEHRPNTENALP